FPLFREIADSVGAYLFTDMAHFAGLVAADLHPNPVPDSHVVSTTIHKTLGGARGGMILSNDEELAKKLNSAVFPGQQGGPPALATRGLGVEDFHEVGRIMSVALTPEFDARRDELAERAAAVAERHPLYAHLGEHAAV